MCKHGSLYHRIKQDVRKASMMAVLLSVFTGSLLLTACNESTNDNANAQTDNQAKAVTLSMNLPGSLTGDSSPTNTTSAGVLAAVATHDTGLPCAYYGPEGEDVFRNGYQVTKFMLSAVATWTCVADRLIELAETVPHDAVLYETENDFDAVGYDPEDPTHYSVTDDSESQTTIRLYYGYSRFTPPLPGEAPQFYVSWVRQADAAYNGRLIINAQQINSENRKPDDPVMMRMDFSHNSLQQNTDMILRFDDGNEWAEGLRIAVSKDLQASPVAQVFTAKGLMNLKRQYFVVDGIDELPTLKVMTVSDSFGNGAAIGEFDEVALPLLLNADTNNHLGNYIFNKTDIYAFEADGDWDWIYKSFASAIYRGGRTTPAVGGTMDPFNPSLEAIAYYLDLNSTEQAYFTGDACNNMGDDCTAMFNAIFRDGFAQQEQNQGTDPQDWRSAAIATPDYLASVYPNNVNWDGAFDFNFTP